MTEKSKDIVKSINFVSYMMAVVTVWSHDMSIILQILTTCIPFLFTFFAGLYLVIEEWDSIKKLDSKSLNEKIEETAMEYTIWEILLYILIIVDIL